MSTGSSVPDGDEEPLLIPVFDSYADPDLGDTDRELSLGRELAGLRLFSSDLSSITLYAGEVLLVDLSRSGFRVGATLVAREGGRGPWEVGRCLRQGRRFALELPRGVIPAKRAEWEVWGEVLGVFRPAEAP